MSICPSVCLSLTVSATTEPIGFYSSWNIPTGPVVVLGYFIGECNTPTPQPQKKTKKSPPIYFFKESFSKICDPFVFFFGWVGNRICLDSPCSTHFLGTYIMSFELPIRAKPLEAGGEAASVFETIIPHN